MPLSTEVRNVADVMAQALREGQGARQSVGAPEVAFGWVNGLPITIASFVNAIRSSSLIFPITRVTPSGTPVAIVAEGGNKPNAVTVTSDVISLVKMAGYADFSLEDALNGDGLLPAIQSALGAGSLLSFETHAMARLAAGAGLTGITGTDWATALVNGQAAVIGQGGNPSLMVVSHVDYGAFVASITGSVGFSHDPASAIGKSFLGSLVHISPKLATGTAYVLDSQSVAAIEHELSPLLIADPYSGSKTNTVSLVSDLAATFEVLNPQHVASVAIGVARSPSSVSEHRKAK